MLKFTLKVVEFGEYIKKENIRRDRETFNQYVYFIRENIYDKLYETIGKNNWEKIYINILCEIVLFYILQQKQEHIDKGHKGNTRYFKRRESIRNSQRPD